MCSAVAVQRLAAAASLSRCGPQPAAGPSHHRSAPPSLPLALHLAHRPFPCRSPRPPAQVNPLAETDTALVAADAKLGFDDNAAFRQPELFAMRDESQEDPR